MADGASKFSEFENREGPIKDRTLKAFVSGDASRVSSLGPRVKSVTSEVC